MLTANLEKTATKTALAGTVRSKRWGSGLWGTGCLVVSLGLHGLLLQLPVPPPARSPEPEDLPLETLAVTVLPTAPTPVMSAVTAPEPPSQGLPPAAPATPVPAPQSTPPPRAPLPPQAEEPPTAEPPTTLLPEPAADPPPQPYSDFPHLAGATAGCQGVTDCWRSPASSWRAAAAALQRQLEAQGFELVNITEQVLGDDTGVRIYAVTRDQAPAYYLHLVSMAGGVLYTMASEPMTAEAIAAIEKF